MPSTLLEMGDNVDVNSVKSASYEPVNVSPLRKTSGEIPGVMAICFPPIMLELLMYAFESLEMKTFLSMEMLTAIVFPASHKSSTFPIFNPAMVIGLPSVNPLTLL